ncbi:MAG: amino acid adenylation domain-containing protein, partial [Planctomycetota bacterium]
MNPETSYAQINDPTQRDYPQSSLHALIDSVCEEKLGKVAVLSGEDTMSYEELQLRSNELANYLRSKEIGPGDLVGLCCDRVVETPSLLLGILKSGAGYVPLDPEYPVDRLQYMVENSELKHIIAHTNQIALIENFQASATIVDRDWSLVSEAGDGQPPVDGDPKSDIAYVIYTSGSTGKPKGVMVQHNAVVNMLWSMREKPGFSPDDRLLATTTLSFDISVLEMFLPLVCGGSLAVIDRQTAKDTSALVSAIEQYDVNFMQATPAMWRMVLEGDFEARPGMKFLAGGEPLPRDLIRPLLQRCDELWNVYGPTETTVWSTLAQIKSDQGTILIGTPLANTQIFIVDEQDQLCPPESPGELLIAGDGVTLGYLKRPELTAEKFCDWNGLKVYRTGDLARLTIEGQLDHLGRMDNQIKFNGHRIELEEIDAAMAKQPGVRQAATVLREDQPGHKRLVGYLLQIPGESVNIPEIRTSIGNDLPEYMVPNVIVTVDEFKYTPSGKLDRKAFPPPSTERPDLEVEYVAPKTELEKQLALIWSELLQIDTVGIRDNFVHLGGDSLRAASIVARVDKEMSLNVTVAEFFDNPTIEAFLSAHEKKESLVERLKGLKDRRKNRGSGFQLPDLNVSEEGMAAGSHHYDEATGSHHYNDATGSHHSGQIPQYAIIGMSARMPGASDLTEYWGNLVEG